MNSLKFRGMMRALFFALLLGVVAPEARADVTVTLVSPSTSDRVTNESIFTLSAQTSDDSVVERVAFERSSQVGNSHNNILNVGENQSHEITLRLLGLGNTLTTATTFNVTAVGASDVSGLRVELIAPDNARTVLKDINSMSGSSFNGTVTVPMVKSISGNWRVAYSAEVGTFQVNSTELQVTGPWTELGSDFSPVAGDWTLDYTLRDAGAGLARVRAVAYEQNSGPVVASAVGALEVVAPQMQMVSPQDNQALETNSETLRATASNLSALRRVRFSFQPTLGNSELPSAYQVAIAQNSITSSNGTFNAPQYASQIITVAPTVNFNINHPRLSQLAAAIVAPDGTSAPLFAAGSFGGTSITGNFSVPQFIGKRQGGTYTLKITDSGTGATGVMSFWAINFSLPETVLGFDEDGPTNNEYTLQWNNIPTREGYYYVYATAETASGDAGRDSAFVNVPNVQLQGKITLAGGALYDAGGDVVVTGDLDTRGSIYPDGEWDLAFDVEAGQTLTLRPQRAGYQFTPATRTLTVGRIDSDNDELDFVATPENTNPELSVDLPRDGVIYRNLPQILGTASDAPAGVREVRVTLRRNNSQYLVPPGALGNADWEWRAIDFFHDDSFAAQTNDAWAHWSYALPTLPEGQYFLIVRAIDNADNRTIATRYVNIAPGGIEGSTLSLALSASTCSEAGGINAVTGTLTLAAPSPQDTIVTLSSSDSTEISVPASVTIPANQTTATFPIAAIDDTIVDGPQNVTISASNAQTGGANAALQVLDDDIAQPTPVPTATALPTATPTVAPTATPLPFLLISATSPTSVLEAENPRAISWRLSRRNGNLAQPLTVTLISSDADALQVPATATFAANETNISVDVASHDEGYAGGNRNIALTASATDGIAQQSVVNIAWTDNDQFDLRMTANLTAFTPDARSATVTLTRVPRVPLSQAPALTVALNNSQVAMLNAPTSATIPAGAVSTSFSVSLSADLSGTTSNNATLRASAESYPSPTLTFTQQPVVLSLTSSAPTLTPEAPSVILTLTRTTNVPIGEAPAMTVNLSNANPQLLDLTGSVVIAAGTSASTCTVRLRDDLSAARSPIAIITARAGGYPNAVLTLTAALPIQVCGPPVPVVFTAEGTQSFDFNIAAGSRDLWVTVQQRQTNHANSAKLFLGGREVASETATNGIDFHISDLLLRVPSPAAGKYTLQITSAGATTFQVRACADLPDLPLNRATIGEIVHNGGMDWKQFDLPSGLTSVDFQIEVVGNASLLDIWRIDDSTQRWHKEQWFRIPGEIDLTIPNPVAGRYILQVRDHGGVGGDESRDYTATITTSNLQTLPRAAGVTPNRGSNIGDVSVAIDGENLDPKATVQLLKAGSAPIVATEVGSGGITDRSRILAGFDLRGKTPGVYSVVVTNPGGRVFRLSNAFTIIANGRPDIWHNLQARAKVRIGRDQSFFLHYGNKGTADAYGVPFSITGIPLSANVTAQFDSVKAPDGVDTTPIEQAPTTFRRARDQAMMIIVPFIPVGSEGTFSFKIRANDAGAFNLQAVRLGALFGEGALNTEMAGTECCGTPGLGKHLDYAQADCIGKVGKFVLGKALGALIGQGCVDNAMNLALGAAQNFEQFARDSHFDTGGDQTSRNQDLIGNMMQMMPDIAKTLILCAGAQTPFGKILTIASEILTLLNDIESVKGIAEECGDAFAPSNPSGGSVAPVNAYDPNDKIGPRGVGTQRYISGRDPMPYTIFFENKATASAPAEQVFVTDQLDKSKYDLSTFALGSIAFADRIVTPPGGLKEWETDVDLRPAKPTIVHISASLNQTTGIVRWIFSSLDPTTGEAPEDPDAGFLNPNRTSPEGEGNVNFTIQAKSNLPTLSRIANQARIVFDTNEHIDTPVWSNLTDGVKPASQVLALPATQNAHRFLVKWSGTDQGAGIRNYTIYVSDNLGRSYRRWMTDTTQTQAIYLGEAGKTYWFYSVARDGANNEELPPRTPDARTIVASADISVTITASPNAPRTRAPITYTITAQNAGSQAATQVLVRQTLPVGATFTSASATIGRPTRSGNFVTLTVPTLARGARMTMTTIVSASQGARLETVAAANAVTPDPNRANNEVTIRTIVPPFVEWSAPLNRATLNAMSVLSGFAYTVPGITTGAPSRVEVVITRNADSKSWTGTTWAARTPLTTQLQVLAGRTGWTRTNSASSPLPNGVNLLEGAYTLEAKLFDKGGESSTATIVVNVDKTVPATVTVSRPTANAVISSVSPITGFATDNLRGSGIASVKIVLQRVSDRKYWNGTTWVSAANPPSMETEIQTATNGRVNWARANSLPSGRNLLSGLYQVTPIAIDNAGNAITATPVRFTVDANAPTISVLTPANNTSVATLARSLGRVVDNAGGSGILRVELFLQRVSDGKWWTGTRWLNRTALTSTIANDVWTRANGWPAGTNSLRGDYTLQAHAIDRAGNRAVAVSSFRIAPTVVRADAEIVDDNPKASRSGVALSSLGVRASDASVVLAFNGILDAEVANDAAHYVVEINGVVVPIESAELRGQTVTLGLAEGALRSGDRVRVTWNDLLDPLGRIISGSAGPMTVR